MATVAGDGCYRENGSPDSALLGDTNDICLLREGWYVVIDISDYDSDCGTGY